MPEISESDGPRHVGRRVALGISLAWGPGLICAVIMYLETKRVPYSVLTFAVVTAITAVVLGGIGSVLMQRRKDRERR